MMPSSSNQIVSMERVIARGNTGSCFKAAPKINFRSDLVNIRPASGGAGSSQESLFKEEIARPISTSRSLAVMGSGQNVDARKKEIQSRLPFP